MIDNLQHLIFYVIRGEKRAVGVCGTFARSIGQKLRSVILVFWSNSMYFLSFSDSCACPSLCEKTSPGS